MTHGRILDHLPESEGQFLSSRLVQFPLHATHLTSLRWMQMGETCLDLPESILWLQNEQLKTSRNLIKERAGWEEVGSDV